ncbi:hypothetical protein MN116_002884 [Schistosoma mekongi]|uniref:Uncharacterized protein n=1 Tax=Schistosoma mekongi TaxID=38744 RepID=A0AAE1ZGI3_SCHME|nr:hypothetical protein MN116_002884 [Schistosoma mekongi]
MSFMSKIVRFKSFVSSKPSTSNLDLESTSKGFPSYQPTSFYNLGFGDEKSFVDVEYISKHEFIRVSGVDFDVQCIDFLVRLCSLLGLRAGDYTILVPCESLSGVPQICWRCVPPSSKLSSWISSEAAQTKLPTLVKLTAKCHLKKSAKLYKFPFPETEIKYPVKPVKTGKEFLNDLGHRIIVYLPGDRKIVVRGRLDQPVNNVLQEVSSERLIQLCDYYIINPKTGTNLDPKDTFLNQNADQIELKKREEAKSKLAGEAQSSDSKVKPINCHSKDEGCTVIKSRAKKKHIKRSAPSVPTNEKMTHQHFSPSTNLPDKLHISSCMTLPSTIPNKADVKSSDDKRNSVLVCSSLGSQANKHSLSKNQSQETPSVANVINKKSLSHQQKSFVLKNSNKKISDKPRICPPPPPPLMPADFGKHVTPTNSCKSQLSTRGSHEYADRVNGCVLDDNFNNQESSVLTGERHSHKVITNPSADSVVYNKSNSAIAKLPDMVNGNSNEKSDNWLQLPPPLPATIFNPITPSSLPKLSVESLQKQSQKINSHPPCGSCDKQNHSSFEPDNKLDASKNRFSFSSVSLNEVKNSQSAGTNLLTELKAALKHVTVNKDLIDGSYVSLAKGQVKPGRIISSD